MKCIILPWALVWLASAASAQAPMSHADRMRKCASEWQMQKHSASGTKYQHFMSDCMKSVAAGQSIAPHK